MRSTAPRLIILAIVAVALALLSLMNLSRAEEGITRDYRVVNGVPVETFALTGVTRDMPAVVVVHGFSGSRQLMYGFAYTLARNGYLAALVDFAGHGASTIPLLQNQQTENPPIQLQQNLQTAVDYVRALSMVDPQRVAILGHSMGAGAVVQYSLAHPDVPATIAVSLGGSNDTLPERADQPRNLLVMVGQNEFAALNAAAMSALHKAYPEGEPGKTYGDASDGTARRVVIVPVVEHISILFSHATYEEMVRWLDATFSIAPPDRVVVMDDRLGWIGLLYLAAMIGFYPLAHTLLRGGEPNAPISEPIKPWGVIALSALASVISPLLLLVLPIDWIPLTVGNYVAFYFLLSGLLLCLALWLAQKRLRFDVVSVRRNGLPAVILAVYALVTLGLPAQLTLVNFSLNGVRLWVMPLIATCLFVFFTADEVLVARNSRTARLGLYAITKLVVLISLVGAIFVLHAPFFIALLVPVFVLMFVWHGMYAYWIDGIVRAPWIAGMLNALVYAWFISAVFAVVG